VQRRVDPTKLEEIITDCIDAIKPCVQVEGTDDFTWKLFEVDGGRLKSSTYKPNIYFELSKGNEDQLIETTGASQNVD
jgi:hypothetical protein